MRARPALAWKKRRGYVSPLHIFPLLFQQPYFTCDDDSPFLVHFAWDSWSGEQFKENQSDNLQAEGVRMKGIVVYDTSYGNTKKVAEMITETLKESGIEVDLFHVKDAKKLSAKEYSFLVLGSPTKFGTMSFAMRGFLGKVKSEEWMNKPFAAFDTENPENVEKKQGSAGEKIAQKLMEKKMNQLAPVLKALVHEMKGPLLEGEIERTKEYAKELAAKLKE
jgi:flavodoxin